MMTQKVFEVNIREDSSENKTNRSEKKNYEQLNAKYFSL